jgi:hypothetical protein
MQASLGEGRPFCEVFGSEWHMINSYLFFASSSTPSLNGIEQPHLPSLAFNFADVNLLQFLVLLSG